MRLVQAILGWLRGKRNANPSGNDQLVERIQRLRAENAQSALRDQIADLYLRSYSSAENQVRRIYFLGLVIVSFFAWAAYFNLDEVTSGSGVVVPSGKVQIIQSLDGGIIDAIHVSEGVLVEEGTPLVQINGVRVESNVAEIQAKVDALTAAALRLRSETNGTTPEFPAELRERSRKAVEAEMETFRTKRLSLESMIASQRHQLEIAQNELALTEPLAAKGLVSDLDVLKIKRSIADNKSKIAEIRGRFVADSASELSKVEAELKSLSAGLVGKKDTLTRTLIKAPKRGIVKNMRVTTLGGVVQSGQEMMEIVPIDDVLIVEAKIRPDDIAFLRPGQESTIKVTAYDSSIFGTLHGTLVSVSPDTIRDDIRRDETYYRAIVKTDKSYLMAPTGKPLPIIAGMHTQVDIKIGQKSVLSYLFKPLLKSREALRER